MRVAQIIVFAEDVARMQAFYRDKLGLPVISAQPAEFGSMPAARLRCVRSAPVASGR